MRGWDSRRPDTEALRLHRCIESPGIFAAYVDPASFLLFAICRPVISIAKQYNVMLIGLDRDMNELSCDVPVKSKTRKQGTGMTVVGATLCR